MRRTAAPPPHTKQAIDELNYIPNATARELRRTTSNKIGLVLPDLVDPYYNGILRGVLRQIRSGDYILNIAFSDQNAKEERKKIGKLINANVAGLLIVTCQPDNREFFQSRVIKSGLPSVFVHQKPNFDANYIGYTPIPGHLALQAGRNLAIFKNSVHKQQVYDYFKWIFEASTSCYYTILGGQSCVRQPYENSEIISQYPWMELTKRPIPHYHSRSVPQTRNMTTMIPINRFETVLCDVVRRVLSSHMALRDSLEIAQVEMQALFRVRLLISPQTKKSCRFCGRIFPYPSKYIPSV